MGEQIFRWGVLALAVSAALITVYYAPPFEDTIFGYHFDGAIPGTITGGLAGGVIYALAYLVRGKKPRASP